MASCMRTGCNNPPLYVLEINVPATGWPLGAHKPLSCIMGLEVCSEHGHDEKNRPMSTFWKENPKIKEIFDTLARGKCPPDYGRSFIALVDLSDKRYRMMKAMRE